MRNALVAGIALATAFLAACGGGGSTSSGGACGSTCNGCCLGTTCVAGTDPTGCGTGSKDCAVCTAGQACQNGLCGGTVQSGIGSKCTTAADCGAGNACAADVPGGGYCTKDCTSASCPSNAACVTISATAKLCLEKCSTDSDCRSEHLCFAAGGGVSLCLPKCTQDSDCGSSNCNTSTGKCAASRVGTACGSDSDCGQLPAFCDKTQAAGYCSLPCGGDKSVGCPTGSNCSSFGGASVCLKGCATDGDCGRSGVSCTADASGIKSCTPACTASSQCGAGKSCDTASGHCVNNGPAAGALGGSCGSDNDCAGVGAGAFCAPPSSGYLNGYCSISCVSQACPSTGTCVAFSSTDHDCLSKCTTAANCRSGYRCYDLGGGAGSVCAAGCSADSDCASTNQACDKNSGTCVDKPTGGTSNITSVTMGTGVQVFTDHLSTALSITVPADAVSITFVGTAVSDPTARIVVYRITDHNGTKIYDYGSVSSPMKVLPPNGPGAFAVLFPNSPNVPFGAGDYTIQLLGSKQTTANVTALVKHAPSQALSAGSIDMNLFFVGLSNLNASSAQAQGSAFQSILSTVTSVWAKAGISIGNVTYNDITGASAQQYGDLKEPDLGALMKLSSQAPNDNALNVFFVHSITSGDTLNGYIILGESAGIPGVPVRGTTGSGLAVTTADYPNGVADIADTWVHEGSHWLGLFHTTESGGTSFDPIPDTPECPKASHDQNQNGVMEPNECVGFGADNEMFWTSSSAVPNHSNLTANQSFVLLRNPAVH